MLTGEARRAGLASLPPFIADHSFLARAPRWWPGIRRGGTRRGPAIWPACTPMYTVGAGPCTCPALWPANLLTFPRKNQDDRAVIWHGTARLALLGRLRLDRRLFVLNHTVKIQTKG